MDGSRYSLAESENVAKPRNVFWGWEAEVASKTKTVTLSAHRVIFRADISETLSSLISQIKERSENSNGHVVQRTLFEKIAAGYPHYPDTNIAVSMRFAFYEEGSPKSIVTLPSEEVQLTTNPTSPPSGTEFLDHEVVIIAKENNLITCAGGTALLPC